MKRKMILDFIICFDAVGLVEKGLVGFEIRILVEIGSSNLEGCFYNLKRKME